VCASLIVFVCRGVCLLGIGHLGINIIKSGISFWIFLPVSPLKGVKKMIGKRRGERGPRKVRGNPLCV